MLPSNPRHSTPEFVQVPSDTCNVRVVMLSKLSQRVSSEDRSHAVDARMLVFWEVVARCGG